MVNVMLSYRPNGVWKIGETVIHLYLRIEKLITKNLTIIFSNNIQVANVIKFAAKLDFPPTTIEHVKKEKTASLLLRSKLDG